MAHPVLAAFPLGPTELLLVLGVVVLLFGGRKLPELAKGLGEGMREFKKATKDSDEDPKLPPSRSNESVDKHRDDVVAS